PRDRQRKTDDACNEDRPERYDTDVLTDPFQAVNEHKQRNGGERDRKSTRLNSSHRTISYAVFCLKKKKKKKKTKNSKKNNQKIKQQHKATPPKTEIDKEQQPTQHLLSIKDKYTYTPTRSIRQQSH